jgi:hypothetical protein
MTGRRGEPSFPRVEMANRTAPSVTCWRLAAVGRGRLARPPSICGRPLQRKSDSEGLTRSRMLPSVRPVMRRRGGAGPYGSSRIRSKSPVACSLGTVESPGFPDPVSPTVRHTLRRPSYASTPLQPAAVRQPAPEFCRSRLWPAAPRRCERSCWPAPPPPAFEASALTSGLAMSRPERRV